MKSFRKNTEVVKIIISRKKQVEKTIFCANSQEVHIEDLCTFLKDGIMCISPTIEILYVKNFDFMGIEKIECMNEETILILENCFIEKTLTIAKGNVVLENPVFSNDRENYCGCQMHFIQNDYVELLLFKESEKQAYDNIYCIHNVKQLKITGDASKTIVTTIEPNQQLDFLEVKNVRGWYAGKLKANKVKIENSEIEAFSNLKYENLEILNSLISSKEALDLNTAATVTVKNSIMQEESISLFTKENVKDENKTALLEARYKLLNCLQEIKEKKTFAKSKSSKIWNSLEQQQIHPFFLDRNASYTSHKYYEEWRKNVAPLLARRRYKTMYKKGENK